MLDNLFSARAWYIGVCAQTKLVCQNAIPSFASTVYYSKFEHKTNKLCHKMLYNPSHALYLYKIVLWIVSHLFSAMMMLCVGDPPLCDCTVLLLLWLFRLMVDMYVVSAPLAVDMPKRLVGVGVLQHKYRWKCCRNTPDTQYKAIGFTHELRKLIEEINCFGCVEWKNWVIRGLHLFSAFLLFYIYLILNPTIRKMCQKWSYSSRLLGLQWNQRLNMCWGRKQTTKTKEENIFCYLTNCLLASNIGEY